LTYLSLRDFFTLVFLYTVSVAWGSDKSQVENTTKTDIVRCITSDKGHICMVINKNDHFYQRVGLTKTCRPVWWGSHYLYGVSSWLLAVSMLHLQY